uniref:Ig-like domain-containing protein n=1 Tax=Cyprinodon variegatus TaxID=28743 RepID=A0A3Q2E3X9_CYPVA
MFHDLVALACWPPFLTSLLCVVFSPADQRIIRAEPGSTVTLPCRPAGNKNVTLVEWTRTDLKDGMYAILYREPHLNSDDTCGSFKNRVNLKDATNGDTSLILTNVTAADTGTYECKVRQEDDVSSQIISTIGLTVKPGESVCFWIRTSSSFLVPEVRGKHLRSGVSFPFNEGLHMGS